MAIKPTYEESEQKVNKLKEQKRAEGEIKGLARFPSENPCPVLRVSKDGTILYANEAALPLLNFWRTQINPNVA